MNMKKKLITTMCGAIVFTSMFGGSFADTVKQTELNDTKAYTISGQAEVCQATFEYESWDQFKTMLNLEKVSETTQGALKKSYEAALAIDKSILEGKTDVSEADYKKVDTAWETFWKLADEHVKFDGGFEDDYDMEPFEVETWDQFKTMLNLEKASSEEQTTMKAIYEEALVMEKTLFDGTKEVSEEDYKKIDTLWDKFWTIADKYSQYDGEESSESFEPYKWDDFKTILKKDTSNQVLEASKALFEKANAEENRIFGEEGNKVINETDFETLDKLWDELFQLVDKHIDETTFE